jgi:hypothetical protein
MGWDAHALRDGRYIRYAADVAELTAAFEAAAQEVKRLAGSVDGWLSHGALDCAWPRVFIEEAIGREAVGIFSPEEVRALVASARWRDPTGLDAIELSMYWSARKFLQTCAEHGLGAWME